MYVILPVFFLLISLVVLINPFQISNIVQTKNGKIRGKTLLSRDQRPYWSFKGIPYAKPPVGPLRFRAPEEPENWSNVLDTLENAPYCAQKNYLVANPQVEGQEDCLFLNVYTPKIKTEQPLPVMVFIHWGGFFAGYSSSKYLGPDYFMDTDVVLVTFNYRLGIFGFLSTFDDASPGNYAFKDQLLALKWVQENIEHFGGDKNNVTLFGQSAGAGSVHFHILSPESKGLFNRAISQSGNALALWAQPMGQEVIPIVQAQASFVGCAQFINNSQEMVDCLRTVDITVLLNSGDNFKFFEVDPYTVFTPVIEKKTAKNKEPFITKLPVEYIKNGEFAKVPWIIGTTSEEGILKAKPLVVQSKVRTALSQNFDELMPKLMYLSVSTKEKNIPNLWKNIREMYFGNGPVDLTEPKNIKGLIDLYTDRSFQYSTYQTALLHSIKGQQIWFYYFDYKGRNTYGDYFAASNETIDYNFGVSHCDDLLYLFKTKALFPSLTNQNDIKLSKKMIKMWTNFATIGDPSLSTTEERWLPLTNDDISNKNLCFLNISGDFKTTINLSLNDGFYNSRIEFWENVSTRENIKELGENQEK